MAELTSTQINDKMAEIMGWVKSSSGWEWITKSGWSTGYYCDKDRNPDKYFDPYEDLNHDNMVLIKWLEEHPDYEPELGVNWETCDDCYLFLKIASQDEPDFVGTAPKYQWSKAICNCLMKGNKL
jgi:hypothetical protein